MFEGKAFVWSIGLVAIIWVIWGVAENRKSKKHHTKTLDSAGICRALAKEDRKSEN